MQVISDLQFFFAIHFTVGQSLAEHVVDSFQLGQGLVTSSS